MVRRLLAAAALWAALGVPASIPAYADRAPIVLDDAQQRDLRAIEAYLDGVRTLQARFTQVSSNGQTASGALLLSRPGRMRIDYDPPSPILMIANGSFLIYHDRALDQVSYVPLASTPASILLDREVRLDTSDLIVTGLVADERTIRVSLTRKGREAEGELTLTFARQPLQLLAWEVEDARQIVTRVTLVDAKFGGVIDNKLFAFRDPRFPREGSYPSGGN